MNGTNFALIRDSVAIWVSKHSVQNNSVANFMIKYSGHTPAEF